VRVVNPGTSGLKPGDTVTGVRIGTSPDRDKAVRYPTPSPERLNEVVRGKPAGATLVFDVKSGPGPQPVPAPPVGPSADDIRRQADAEVRAEVVRRLTINGNPPTEAEVEAWLALIRSGKIRLYDIDVEIEYQRQLFRDVMGREPDGDGAWIRIRAWEVVNARARGESTAIARQKTRELMAGVPETRGRIGERLKAVLGRPVGDAEVDEWLVRIRSGKAKFSDIQPAPKR
jgi:hypothetical protein